MTDRELLELAAKAAGMDEYAYWADLITDYDSRHYGGPALHAKNPGGQCQSWNPITDDGDALRLAVKLRLEVDCEHDPVCAGATRGDFFYGTREPIGSDPEAATRRAIVRAAAEIGKAFA